MTRSFLLAALVVAFSFPSSDRWPVHEPVLLAQGSLAFFDAFVEPREQKLLADHVPDVGLRWVLDEETSNGLTPPFRVYTGIARGKVAVASARSANFQYPSPDGTIWQEQDSTRNSL